MQSLSKQGINLVVWCTPSGWICYENYHQCFHRFCSILNVIWYSSGFIHRSCFSGSSYECSHLPCWKYENNSTGGPHYYGKGTTGLECPLQSPPYHCGVSSWRHCPLKHMPPSHCGLVEVDATFCCSILHCTEDLQVGVWSSASSHHGVSPPGLLCVSTKAVSNGHCQASGTCLDWWRVRV